MKLDFSHAALIEVDVQNDFCPAYTGPSGRSYPQGALAVADGGAASGPLNVLAPRFAASGGRVIATADWHPPGHLSFASSHPGKQAGDAVDLPASPGQLLWPDHCVQGSRGAEFHESLDLRPVNLIIRKGCRKGLDSYSAFFENDRISSTGLDAYLRGLGVKSVALGGLATDYCVLYSALDAARLGYQTIVLLDAVRAVDYPAGSADAALNTMREAGVILLFSEELA